MGRLKTTEQKLNQAFHMAYFIHQDRAVARRIAIKAVRDLDASMTSQDKRYWHNAGQRSTVCLSEDHMLQRLVMIASEPFEKGREKYLDRIDEDSLLIHFIKHLARVTCKLTPFYTTLAVCRILHNYSTTETQEIDTVVMQDPDGGRDASFIRARKKVLIAELQKRFGDLLTQSRGPGMEIRFSSHEDPLSFLELVRSCRIAISPWFVSCINFPPDYNPTDDCLDELSTANLSQNQADRIQLNRMHAVLDLNCFSLLIKGLRVNNMKTESFNDPEDTLEIPAFNLGNGRPTGRRGLPVPTTDLSEEDLSAMVAEIETEKSARSRWRNGSLRIIIDGLERARLHTRHPAALNFRLDGGEELIEIVGELDGRDTLLATRLLSYDDDLRLTDEGFDLSLPGRASLQVAFELGESSEVGYSPANLTISLSKEETWLQGLLSLFGRLGRGIKDLPKVTAAWPLSAILAIVFLLAGGYAIGKYLIPSGDESLAALYETYRGQRPYESRIRNIEYSRYSVTRGESNTGIDANAVRLTEMKIREGVSKRNDAGSHYALGLFHLLNRNLDDAIGELKKAVSMDPENAGMRSDLGAALLEKGRLQFEVAGGDAGTREYGESHDHLSEALKMAPDMPEALFNRAICNEFLKLDSEAVSDWERYLQVDPGSKWADEARARLDALKKSRKDHSMIREENLRKFLAAYEAKDVEEAWEAISRNRELLTESIIWQQLLHNFFDARARGDAAKSGETIRAMIFAGQAEELKAGDAFVLDLALYYRDRTDAELRKLAGAHALMEEANRSFMTGIFDQASKSYLSAIVIYEGLGDVNEALIAKYLEEYCKVIEARNREPARLLGLLGEAKYLWIKAQLHNALGTSYTNIVQPEEGIRQTKISLGLSERLQDHFGIQRNQCELATAHLKIRAIDKAFEYLGKCLQSANRSWPGFRQTVRYYNIANQVYLAAGNKRAAEAFSRAAFSLASEEMKDPGFIYTTSISLAEVYRRTERPADAERMYMVGYNTARDNSRLRAFKTRQAYSAGLLGAFYYEQKDYQQAIRFFTESIKLHQQLIVMVGWYEALKGRFLANITIGNDEQAYADLEEIRRYSENYRKNIEKEAYRNSFFSFEQEFNDTATEFLFVRGAPRLAFDHTESTRARSLYDLIRTKAGVAGDETGFLLRSVSQPRTQEEITAEMPQNSQIVQYSVLRDKILIWVISKERVECESVDISNIDLGEKVAAYRQHISEYRKESYSPEMVRAEGEFFHDLLISPIEKYLDKRKHICIVPDKALNHLPFLTLRSRGGGGYLVENYSITFMPSSTVYLHSSNKARELKSISATEKLLAVGVSTIDKVRFGRLDPLPNAGSESMTVCRQYKISECLIDAAASKSAVISRLRSADVVHIASHYLVNDKSPMQSQLLLTNEARRGSETDTLKAHEIYAEYRKPGSRTRLAVLSSCDSGIESYLDGEGMIGMSRIFIASDIPLVAASLWPVDSRATEHLMIKLHMNRKQAPKNMTTVNALRKAQCDMIASKDVQFSRPGYWAGFILIGGSAEF